ncbi:MarR family transcriptional regulator, transcriptional regulator for hemolysin [Vibrio xiamenensis]|uniref:MarR family transcriptional regulator, transcriptional regulator for hemolysin n=1 Tax=Vibrio xiamenensis TaxID=861298 RepID=A0A1G8DLS9_9VIBR|nr:MarR family transcriptional regulator [Vibrio xiamenensis]SDH58617.1 MarR family transcriptional regulator, transcriptional regulator for hemolysin [Vibrio xiamenensis]
MTPDCQNIKELSLVEQMSRVTRLWKHVADQELAPLGLTHSRWTALWKLKRLGDKVSQKTLADGLEIELASLMRTLKQLEEQQFITRHSCEQDKRVRIVCLTEQGEELLEQLEERITQVRRKLLQNVSDQEFQMMRSILERVAHNASDVLSQ